MFVTPLNFQEVLEKFYSQHKYAFMLLFVSSFDGRDRSIIRDIVQNARLIDRVTGEMMCFFYFVPIGIPHLNGALVRWIKDIPDHEPLYGFGVSVTMETADDICKHFGIRRSFLPGFILVSHDKTAAPQLLQINKYHDLEAFLSPLNVIHSYLEDRTAIIYEYETKRRDSAIEQEKVGLREKQRFSWMQALRRHERKREQAIQCNLPEQVRISEFEIQKYQAKLDAYPPLEVKGIDESIEYPQGELDDIKRIAIKKLNFSLRSHDGENIINSVESITGYTEAILKVWTLVRTQDVRISILIDNIREKIREYRYDVFISCKSQDYTSAYELYNLLAQHGYTPFLADASIKEIGIDQYTAVIGEVIDVCKNMIVFATDINYIESTYVEAEWHAFINDINTGYKPYAKIVTILSPEIDVHQLPIWLRDKQSFTTENYRDRLIYFLEN